MDKEIDAARQSIETNDLATATRSHQNAIKLIAHTDGNRPIFSSGLQFRVERSRYYVQRFKDFVDFLGIGPIEGYQPYDLFVKGRLGGVYDYIDRLGRRQERAIRGTESIYQLISLKEAAETSNKIAEANRQNSIISKAIEKLQTKAEIALLAVILPHYLIEMMNDMKESLDVHGDTLMRWDKAIVVVGVLFAGMSLATYIYEIFKARDFDRLHDLVRKYSVLIAFSAAFVVFIVHR